MNEQLVPNRTIQECVDRLRRIETRMTRFMEENGFDTQVQRATWLREGRIEVPTPSCSIKEIIASVPRAWPASQPIQVTHKGELLACITVP